MARFFQKIFNLYPGEEKNALLFSFLAYLWAFAITSGTQFSDALFLLHVGAESLPLAYGMTAGGMLMMAFAFLHSIHRWGTYRSFLSLILIGIAFYSFMVIYAAMGLVTKAPWFWFAFKVSAYIFFAFGLTSYWTFVDEYHDIRDAKRMYTLFISSIFLGSITTGTLMRSAVLRLDALFFVILLIFCSVAWMVRWIREHMPLFVHEETEQETVRSGKKFALPSLIRSILSSRITLLLLTGDFLMQILVVLTEFNYLSAFTSYFTALEGEPVLVGEGTEAMLTRFLGQLVASVATLKLLFGFFLYSRIIRRFGLGAMLPISPILLFLLFASWFVSDSLAIPILGFFLIEGSFNVNDDNNFNLLLNAVPAKLKYKIRVAIESFFEPIGMLTSSLILSFFHRQSKIIAFILSAIWLFVILLVRKEYLKGIFQNLAENTIRFSRTLKDWISSFSSKERLGAEYRLLSLVKQGAEDEKILAAKALLSFDDPQKLPPILHLADEFAVDMKKRFIALLENSSFVSHPAVLELLGSWLRKETDPELRGMIQFYFARHSAFPSSEILSELGSDQLLSRAAAITSLKRSAPALPSQTLSENRMAASLGLQQLLTSQNSREICMGLQILSIDAPPSDVDLLIPFLRHPSVEVARCAAQGVFQVIDKTCRRQAETIIERLNDTNDTEVRSYCLRALGKLGDSSYGREMILHSIHFRPNERRLVERILVRMGLKTVPMLVTLTRDVSLHDRCRLLAGRILGRLALPQLRINLSEIIGAEIERAYFYYYHAHHLPAEYPSIDLSILVDSLKTGYDSVIDFIIQLLAVAGEVEDEEMLSRSLHSKNPKVRSQAIEALEKTCDPQIFSKIEPLLEDIPVEEKLKGFMAEERKPWTLSELLDKLDSSPVQADQIVAATYQYRLNLPGWRESLRRKMSSQEEIFHNFAYELLEQ